MIISLVAHYRYLFAWLGLGFVFMAGGLVGFLIGMAAFQTRAAVDARSGVSTELSGLHARHAADIDTIRRQEVRLSTQKAQIAEITDHLARAIEAIK